jgi:competence protein ComEC
MEHVLATSWSHKLIFVFIFSFVFGILVSSFVFISPLLSLLVMIVAGVVLLAEKILNKKVEKEIILLSLILISFACGALRYSVKDFHEPLTPTLTGIVASEPEQRDNATRFVFLAENGERALVSTELYSPVWYGDKVILKGAFKTPGIIEDQDGGRPFDYGDYLAKDDIYHTMSFAELEVVQSGQGSSIKSALLKLKRSFVGKIRETFSEPYASLLAGLIVSGRDAMPADILEEFRRAGVIHIVVLSGYNITIIADFLRRFFEKIFLLSRFTLVPALAPAASIIGILLFVLMTGAEATVVRAAIMVLVVIAAKLFGRKYSAPRALIVAGFIMLLENPKILVFDPSFQLSFLATLALIYVVPIVEKYLEFVTEKWGLRSIIATTLGTQLTVLPMLIYSVGDVSLVSLPANILILLIIPYTMLLGFIATTLAYVSGLLAVPIAFVANLFLAWIIGVAYILGNLSFASISVPNLSPWLILFIYIALVSGRVLLYLYPQTNEGSTRVEFTDAQG